MSRISLGTMEQDAATMPVSLGDATSIGAEKASVVKSRRLKRFATTSPQAVERAVYAYIRAVRALGRTRINSREVSMALKLKLEDVDEAVRKLRTKGVKPAA